MLNNSNRCYMNTTFQSLLKIPGLSEYFLSGLYLLEIQRGDPETLCSRFYELAVANQKNTDATLDPQVLVQIIHKNNSMFSPDSQEDAHEFLLYLLNEMSDELSRVRKNPVKTRSLVIKPEGRSDKRKMTASNHVGGLFWSKGQSIVKQMEETDDQKKLKALEKGLTNPKLSQEERTAMLEEWSFLKWEEHLSKNQSIISDVLLGQMLSTIKCSACKVSAYNFDPYLILELSLPDDAKEIGFNELMKFNWKKKKGTEETVEWKCPSCNQSATGLCRGEIWKIPPVLIVSFNRFVMVDNRFRKNTCVVNIKPEEDMSEFISSPYHAAGLKYEPFLAIVRSD